MIGVHLLLLLLLLLIHHIVSLHGYIILRHLNMSVPIESLENMHEESLQMENPIQQQQQARFGVYFKLKSKKKIRQVAYAL